MTDLLAPPPDLRGFDRRISLAPLQVESDRCPRTAAFAKDLERRASRERGVDPDRARFFLKIAADLRVCAESGSRCGRSSYCPRCAGRAARRNRRRLEQRMLAARPDRLFFLTATVACDSASYGHRTLATSLRKLRRRQVWRRSVAGSEEHLQAKPCRAGSARRWNVHIHAVVELRAGATLDHQALDEAWRELLGHHGLPGRIDVRPIRNQWAATSEEVWR